MKTRALLAAIVGAAGLGAACSSGVTSNIPVWDMPIPDTTMLTSGDDLRIAPFDVVEIKVFGVDDLNGPYQVDPDGKIKFPLIGVIDAQGFSVFELAARIEEKLQVGFLRDPQVTVRISETSGQQMTVEGAVGKPGMYPVRGRLSLLQAVAIAGGPSPGADSSKVVIFRTVEGKRMAAAFDLLKIRAGQAEDPLVYGNDIIVMDGSGLRAGYDEFIRAIPVLGLFLALG
jgi:polysaccharide export outer membrane protein